jgi:hypothetical protein
MSKGFDAMIGDRRQKGYETMRGSIIGMGIVSAVSLAAAPVGATHRTTHHASSSAHHVKSHHAAKPSHHPKPDSRASRQRPSGHETSAPSGTTAVPTGGIKLYCGTGHSPLMVRKMTQGAGTTVTVICR